ncbi:hypothetical protein [Rhizocola hellebori]|nr:hypothetical protein [Rhizocola hellebori]
MRYWLVVTATIFVVLVGGAAGLWLVGVWDLPRPVTEFDRLRLDRIKTGLTIAAGLAAGVTLLVALRRQAMSERAQRYAEQAQRFAENEALEQRTTALYVAAADQLASDKAPVRLAGLYALERLGHGNPMLRQTVIDVWCAYLRMPYTPPLEVLRQNDKKSPAFPQPDSPPDQAQETERQQELEVRLTAQRLLAAHLRGHASGGVSSGSYWYAESGSRLNLDLTRAVLVDFDLKGCVLGSVTFNWAQFHGATNLIRTEFHGNASMHSIQFHRAAMWKGARFHSEVFMRWGKFYDTAFLHEVRFYKGTDLSWTHFYDMAFLDSARFYAEVELQGVEFHQPTHMDKTQFHADADLEQLRFHDNDQLFTVWATSRATLPAGYILSSTPVHGSLHAVVNQGRASKTERTSQPPEDAAGQ